MGLSFPHSGRPLVTLAPNMVKKRDSKPSRRCERGRQYLVTLWQIFDVRRRRRSPIKKKKYVSYRDRFVVLIITHVTNGECFSYPVLEIYYTCTSQTNKVHEKTIHNNKCAVIITDVF